MPITLHSAGTVTERAAEASTNVPYPASISLNDTLVLVGSVNTGGAANITTPSGWTKLFGASLAANVLSPHLSVFIKVADGTETGSLTVAHSGGNSVSWWQIIALTGVDTTTPQDVTLTSVDMGTAAINIPLPTLTPVTSGDCLFYACAENSTANTNTAPAGFTELGDRSTGTRAATTGYQIYNSTSATGTTNVAQSASTRAIGVLIAFRPAGANAVSASDTASPADSASRAYTASRPAADTASAADSAARSSTKTRAAADTATSSDAAARAFTLTRAAADTATPADTAALSAGQYSRTASDTASSSDAIARSSTKTRAAADTAAPADTATRAATRSRAAADSASPADTASNSGVVRVRTASDVAGSGDSASRHWAAARAALEPSTAADSAARTWTTTRAASDVAAPGDAASRAGMSRTRTAADIATPGDVATKVVTLGRAALDVAAAADQVTRAEAMARAAVDVAAPLDVVLVQHARQVTIRPGPVLLDHATGPATSLWRTGPTLEDL